MFLSFSITRQLVKKNLSYFNQDLFQEQKFGDLSLIDLSVEQLIESDFQLGCRFSLFDKLNFTYLSSKRFTMSIINLFYTMYNLKLAVYFLTFVVSRRGKVLFYDGSQSTQNFVSFVGLTSKQYFINQKWMAGLLTNFKHFYRAVFFREASMHFRFNPANYIGMKYIHRPPNVSCLLNINRESAAFLENFRLGIPVISLVNLDDLISGVTFPIFSNNLSSYTFITFFSILRSSVLNGYKHELYKFYRKTIKRLIRVRFIRYFWSRRVRNRLLFVRFRLYFFKLFFKHSQLLFDFFKFCIFPIYTSYNDLGFSEKQCSHFVDFYTAYPFVSQIMFNFFDELFFPVLNFFFSFKNLTTSVFFSSVKEFSQSSRPTRLQILQSYFKNFLSESTFCSFFLEFLNRFSFSFFSSKFFFFVDLFLSRYFPLLRFLFGAFLRIFIDLNEKFLQDFAKTLRLLFLIFKLLGVGRIFVSAKTLFQKNSSSLLAAQYIHSRFPFLRFKVLGFPELKTWRFLKILSFRVSTFPFFGLNVNFKTVTKLGKFFFKFRREYGLFRYVRFSKCAKRAFRIFKRSSTFYRYLRKYVYKTKKQIRRKFFYYSLKNVKYFSLSSVKKSNYKFSSTSFLSKFMDLSEYSVFLKQYSKSFSLKLKSDSPLARKFKRFLLAFVEEEFESYRFPFNQFFFYFYVKFGSVYLAREFQRNFRLFLRKEQVRKNVQSKKSSRSLFFNVKNISFLQKKFFSIYYYLLKYLIRKKNAYKFLSFFSLKTKGKRKRQVKQKRIKTKNRELKFRINTKRKIKERLGFK